MSNRPAAEVSRGGRAPHRRRRRWFLLVGAVIALHAAAFALCAWLRPLPRSRFVPPQNFAASERTTVDPQTGAKTVVRQFTVSTRLAPAARPPGTE